MNRYCLSGNNDTILNFTKKDLIYLNELITNNLADEKILQEKNIIAPQEIQENSTFCPRTLGNNPQRTTFWPNVTNIQDMCQEENVVAIAKIPKGGLNGEFWYLDENKKIQKSPPIVFTRHNLNGKDGYAGKLELTDGIKKALSGAKIQKLDNPFSPKITGDIVTIGNEVFQWTTNAEHRNYYLRSNKIITFLDHVNTITF